MLVTYLYLFSYAPFCNIKFVQTLICTQSLVVKHLSSLLQPNFKMKNSLVQQFLLMLNSYHQITLELTRCNEDVRCYNRVITILCPTQSLSIEIKASNNYSLQLYCYTKFITSYKFL